MAMDTSRGGVRGRRPSFRGRSYSRISRGIEIWAKWPKKQSKRRPQNQLDQMEFFRQTQWAYKYMWADLANDIRAAVAGTPLLPRDLYLKATSGRLAHIILPSGERLYSMAGIMDVSANLDLIGQVPGDIMVRRAERWDRLARGTVNQVLTMVDPDEPPEWADVVAPPSGSWSLFHTQVLAAGTPAIVVDVSAYDEVYVIGRGLTSTATTTRGVQVSTNGGVSFYKALGEYQTLGATGTETATWLGVFHNTPTAAARSISGYVSKLRSLTGPKNLYSDDQQNTVLFVGNLAAPITHIRIGAFTGVNTEPVVMNAGTVWVWGR